jgi:chaperonin GroEL (HSP60 family)
VSECVRPGWEVCVSECLCVARAAAGEFLHIAEPLLEKNVHPTVIVRGYMKALEDSIRFIDEMAFPLDVDSKEQMLKIVNSCIGTKYTSRFGTLMAVCTPTPGPLSANMQWPPHP